MQMSRVRNPNEGAVLDSEGAPNQPVLTSCVPFRPLDSKGWATVLLIERNGPAIKCILAMVGANELKGTTAVTAVRYIDFGKNAPAGRDNRLSTKRF